MSKTENNELPKRPQKIRVYGKHLGTVLMMHEMKSHSIFVEKIDRYTYEITFCIYSQEAYNHPKQRRVEYVMHTNKARLRALMKDIQECLNL